MASDERKKPEMVTIFIYYILGFAAFLVVAYLCVQIGWLFEAEGRVNWGGLAGLSILLVAVFVFITLVCSVQLSGWRPPQGQFSGKVAAMKRFQSQLKDIDIGNVAKDLKSRLADGADEIGDAVSSVWEEQGSFGVSLPSSQGITAVNMLIQDISQENFLNRLNPLNLVNFRKKVGDGVAGGIVQVPEQLTPEEQKQRADQEIFRIRIETIEKHFGHSLNVPSTVLPEQLRRVEEVYLAIATGVVTYPYLRFEFAFPRNQALNFLELYEHQDAKKPLSVRMPVVMDLFGEKFDLGMCTLSFADAHVDPTLEKAKLMEVAHHVKLRIIPNQKPGQIRATYEKFQLPKTSGEQPSSNPAPRKV